MGILLAFMNINSSVLKVFMFSGFMEDIDRKMFFVGKG